MRIMQKIAGRRTRLVNRIRIQAPGPENRIANFFVGNGAFIMEQRMTPALHLRFVQVQV